MPPRKVFLVMGTNDNWKIGREKLLWGMPQAKGNGWRDTSQILTDAEFRCGSEFLACVGHRALFRAVVDGEGRGPYWDAEGAPFGESKFHDYYPVRFKFTRVRDVNADWFTGPPINHAFRTVLDEVYLQSVFVLKSTAKDTGLVQMETLFGTTEAQGALTSGPTDQAGCGSLLREDRFGLAAITSPDALEDRVGDLFRVVGFRVERLGHNRPYERVPDGLGCLARSMVKHLESLNMRRYFVLWDCKFSVGSGGLGAEEERALKEYATEYADRAKGEADAPAFWFLLVGKEEADAAHMRKTADKLANDQEVRRYGCLGVRAVSYQWVRNLADEAFRCDPDEVLTNLVPDRIGET